MISTVPIRLRAWSSVAFSVDVSVPAVFCVEDEPPLPDELPLDELLLLPESPPLPPDPLLIGFGGCVSAGKIPLKIGGWQSLHG